MLGFEPTVERTRKIIEPKFNPYFNSVWGDFDWVRKQFKGKYDVRCYVTTQNQLKKVGIKGHIGMYDMADKDGVLDFYIGVPTSLDSRAKKNGFRTNLAWLFCHEWCHGMEQQYGSPDRVHEMEKAGKLKKLAEEEISKEEKIEKINTLKQLIQGLLNKLRNRV